MPTQQLLPSTSGLPLAQTQLGVHPSVFKHRSLLDARLERDFFPARETSGQETVYGMSILPRAQDRMRRSTARVKRSDLQVSLPRHIISAHHCGHKDTDTHPFFPLFSQCAKRHQKCVYPEVQRRRGRGKRKIIGPNDPIDTLKGKRKSTSTKRSRCPPIARTKPREPLLAAPDAVLSPTLFTSDFVTSEYNDDNALAQQTYGPHCNGACPPHF